MPATRVHPDPLSPALSWALGAILPGPDETLLLRALLHRGASAREAWTSFGARIEDLPGLFRTDTGGRKRLSPLLLRSIRENHIDGDPRLMTVLRTAWLREELRSREYARILEEALGALGDAGVPVLVLKGAALAASVYPEPCLRHAHDIDLLVAEGAEADAARVLARLGLRPSDDLRDGRGRSFRHRTGLPVLLLERLYRERFYHADRARLFAEADTITLAGVEASTPRDEDQLVHALGHASYCPGRTTLAWATDAWMLLHAPRRLDWERVSRIVAEARLDLPVFVLLRYFAEELDAPIPVSCLADLGRRAAGVSPLARDVALSGKRRARPRHPDLAGRGRPGPLELMRALGWELVPSRAYLRWVHGDGLGPFLPLLYLARPLTWARDKLGWRIRQALFGPSRSA